MKKFAVFLLILIILGAAVFFLGWSHLTVPPGSFGVMRSKTHGLESHTIQDGEFNWFWYKLIPTNAKVSVFTLGPVNRSIRSSGSLPSGDVFASLAGLQADFSWEITGELSFSLNPDYLPGISSRENIIDNDGLRRYEENLAIRIENIVLARIRNLAENDDIESLIFPSSLPELEREILRTFPEIVNFSSTIQVIRFPHYELYRSVRALYQEYMAQQSLVLSQDVIREAERRINSRMRLDELAQYGELLTRYPILLEFLMIERDLAD
jgi:hypothetical protein